MNVEIAAALREQLWQEFQEEQRRIRCIARKKYPASIERKIIVLYDKRISCRKIGNLLGCDKRYVSKVLREKNIKIRNSSCIINFLSKKEINQIKRLYLAGATAKFLSKKYHVNPVTFTKFLRQQNIKVRQRHELIFSLKNVFAAKKMYENFYNTREIGDFFGVSKNFIIKKLREIGVRIRSRGEALLIFNINKKYETK